jgi:hypothetical protein
MDKKTAGKYSEAQVKLLDPGAGFFVWVPQKHRIKHGWFMAFQQAFVDLAKDDEISKISLRVLMYLMGTLDFENYIQVRQSEIVNELSIDKGNVSRAVRCLVDRGIISKRVSGKLSGYRLNEFYGWKGKVKNMPPAASHLTVVK